MILTGGLQEHWFPVSIVTVVLAIYLLGLSFQRIILLFLGFMVLIAVGTVPNEDYWDFERALGLHYYP